MDKFAHAKRYVMIVDFNHVVHRFYNAMGRLGLSTVLNVDGELRKIDTGVAKGVLQYLVNLSGSGRCPMVIACDRPVKSRKEYFSQNYAEGVITASSADYKGDRAPINFAMRDSADLILTVLRKTGAYVVAKDNYEADDIIVEAIRVAKLQYPDLPIYVLANDLDLAPLVDEQVSMYRYPTKQTDAEEGHLLLNKYQQITPRNYSSVMEASSGAKGLVVPYNSLLLTKLFRGDKSDGISIMKGWGPKRYNRLIENMIEDEVDLSIFSYYQWETVYEEITTGQKFKKLPAYATKDTFRKKLSLPQEFHDMVDTLKGYLAPEGATDKEIKEAPYLTQDELDELIARYHGINLNGAFLNTPNRRAPFILDETVPIPTLNCLEIAKQGTLFQMNIKV